MRRAARPAAAPRVPDVFVVEYAGRAACCAHEKQSPVSDVFVVERMPPARDPPRALGCPEAWGIMMMMMMMMMILIMIMIIIVLMICS